MPSLRYTIILLALVALALAIPAPIPGKAHIQKRSFKVERVPNPNYVRSVGAGTRALVKAHRKFSISLPPGLLSAMDEAQKGKDQGGVQAAEVKDTTKDAKAKTKANGNEKANQNGNADANAAGGLASLESALEGLLGGAANQPAAAKDGAGAAKGQKGGAGAAKGTGKKGGADTGKAKGQKGDKNGGAKAGAGAAAGAGAGVAAGNGTAADNQNSNAGKGSGKKGGQKGGAGAAAGNGTAGNDAAGNSTGGAGVGLVTATPKGQDVEFLSPVSIGGQTLNMDFDSGSSDLWVFNTQLSAAAQAGHTLYDPTKSNTFKAMTGSSFSVSYGDGSGAAGSVGTDVVDIGGASFPNQAVEIATDVSQSFIQDQANNGLVGLAFSKLNTVKPVKQKTFFDNVMSSLAEPVFTADLRSQAVGAYEFGRIDATKFNGSLSWAAINTTQGFWQFTSEKVQVGNGQVLANPGGQAIADTGTTLMLVDPKVADAYYSQVPGAKLNQTVGGVTFPCASQLPDMQVAVGDNMAVVRGSDINFAPVDAGGSTCFGGVQALAGGLQIYGDIFFKSQFVVFNGGNNSLGVAPHQ